VNIEEEESISIILTLNYCPRLLGRPTNHGVLSVRASTPHDPIRKRKKEKKYHKLKKN